MAVAPALADAFIIEGRRRISGTIRAAGNKNGALPILAATILAGEPVTLRNLPRIRDGDTMLALLSELGADASWIGPNEVQIDTTGISKAEPDLPLGSRSRGRFPPPGAPPPPPRPA